MADDVLSFQFTDDEGLVATIPISIPSGQTAANVLACAQALAVDFDHCSGAELTDIAWTSHLALPATEENKPFAGDDREQGATLLMSAGERLNYGVHIPAIQADKVQGKTIIQDTDIDNLVTQLTTATNGITPTDGRGNALVSLVRVSKSIRRK